MKKNLIETIMGAIVLFVAAFFVNTAINSSGVSNSGGYKVYAKFEQIGGISVGSDVRIGGIKIGTVTEQKLDPQTYRASLGLNIQNNIKLPTDSSAEIASESLLGGKYVNIVPGAMDEYMEKGDEIEYTQSAVNLEQLIGKFAFGGAGDGDKEKDASEGDSSLNNPL